MDDTKLKQFATLLAQSTLEPDVKESIMSNLEALSPKEFDALFLALQNEEKALGKISSELADEADVQREAWQKIEQSQQRIADEIIDRASKGLGDEAAVSTIRKSLE